jgi:hypothetical protein
MRNVGGAISCYAVSMPNRSSKRDVNQMAALIARMTTTPPGKDPLAVELGRRGGLRGGKARAENLSPAKRTAIAKKAARTRWAKKHG